MADYLKISIIGAGNVAWHLARRLEDSGHYVVDVYSRNPKNAQKLADRLYDAEVKNDLNYEDSKSELFILAVVDSALEEVAGTLQLPEGSILVHTSGAMPLSVLGYADADFKGVFYPLQTFSKSREIDWKSLPFLIEAEDRNTLKVLNKLARSLGSVVKEMNSKERQTIHLSAVFASNFINYMLVQSAEILENHKIDFRILAPLIAETIHKALEIGPEDAQTGPARRGDLSTLERHLTMLGKDSESGKLYATISQAILDHYFG